MEKYLMAIDQGTTGTMILLVDRNSNELISEYSEHTQIYPNPGWVEHDPEEIWNKILSLTDKVMSRAVHKGISISNIVGIGIANQGETCLIWNKVTGKPVYNAIVWQCRRTDKTVDALKKIDGFEEKVENRTGLVVDPYFSATKFKWILDNVNGVQEELKKGNLLAGTLDTYIIWKMTGGKSFYTDVSTASRTMLFNIHTLDWDNELLNTVGIPKEILPQPVATAYDYGITSPEDFCSLSIPIQSSMVDQAASLFGHGCFEAGMVKNSYGTGCFLWMNIGDKPRIAKNGILTVVAWQVNGETTYAYDGGVYIAGAAIQWLKNGLGIISNYPEADRMAESIEDTGGLYFVPAFSGLAVPHWDQYARGLIIGITGSTTQKHIARATLESVALQVYDVTQSMDRISGKKIQTLKVDGGITNSDFTMQFQADISGIKVQLSGNTETTSLGVAYMAGLQSGVWNSIDEIKSVIQEGKLFLPKMKIEKRNEVLEDWTRAVERSKKWKKG